MKVYPILLATCLLNANMFAQTPTIEWQKPLGGSSNDATSWGQQTSDGGYIVAGWSGSNDGNASGNHGGSDYWIVKLNSTSNIIWQKSLGGTNSDEATNIQQTSDGGYIVTGFSNSNNGDVSGNHGNLDFWVVKLNSTGNIVWQKSLGGTSVDQANSIQQTTDGGYILAGYTSSNNGDVSGNHGDGDAWVVKLNSIGNIVWQKTLGGTSFDSANNVKQTTDGGYIVVAQTQSNDGDVSGNHGGGDAWIIKLNSIGNIIWQKTLGGTGGDSLSSIEQTSDGGYICAGSTNSNDGDVSGNHGAGDAWVVKLNSMGNLVWQKTLGGTGHDSFNSIKQTIDGGFICAGLTYSNDGDVSGNHGISDCWVIKLNSTGNLVWQKTLGGTNFDFANNIQQTTDGGYVVIGSVSSNDGDVSGHYGNNTLYDYWVVKLKENSGTLTLSEINTYDNIIYPNPSINFITIQNTKNSNENFNYSIIDLSGRIIKSGNSKFNEQINIQSLTKGEYIIQFKIKKGKTISKKLIKN